MVGMEHSHCPLFALIYSSRSFLIFHLFPPVIFMKLHPPLLCPSLLLLALVSAAAAADPPRGILDPPSTNTATTAADPTTTAAVTSPTPATSANTPTTANTTPSTTQGTTTQQQTTGTPQTTTQQTTAGTQTTPPPPSNPTQSTTLGASPPPASVSSDGAIIVTSTQPLADSSSTSAAAATATQSGSDESDGGLSAGSIIGMSVAAGVAVLCIIGFFVWKFTRKRFSDFDDNEAIKWPELNTRSGNDGLNSSAQNVGRVGVDTGSEVNLSRIESTSNYSTPDFGTGGHDPYAVPPLPHLNPNQPYRDDPSPSNAFYDPYRGPVPGTIETGTSDWQPEAYPMTQLGGTSGRASPAPDFHGGTYGRASPAPLPFGGRASPGPQAAYGGRASPGPQAAYGRASPGPQAAYGRASPGPQAAYTTGPGY